jgi:hypothetical protein
MFNKKKKNKKKNKETNKKTLEDYGYTNNVLLTENGLIFVNDEEFIKEKIIYDNYEKMKGGGCEPLIYLNPCKYIRGFLQGLIKPMNFILKIIPTMLNILTYVINKIIKVMAEILDFLVMILNHAINNPIFIINFIIKQLRAFLELLLSVLRGNPLKIAMIIILPYVYTAANFILTHLYVFPLGYFGPFFRMFIGFILGREWKDTKMVGLTLNDAIKISFYIIIGIYIACYYSFFKLIFDI